MPFWLIYKAIKLASLATHHNLLVEWWQQQYWVLAQLIKCNETGLRNVNSGQFSSVSRCNCCFFPTLSPCCSPRRYQTGSSCSGTGGVVQNQAFAAELNWLWTEGLKCNSIPHSLLLLHTWSALKKQAIAVGLIFLWQILTRGMSRRFFKPHRIWITLFLLCPSHILYFHFGFWGKTVKTSVWNVAPKA